MRTCKLLILVAVMARSGQLLSAQELPAVSGQWKIRKGDDPSWSDVHLNDSVWETIPVGKPWETAFGNYDGYGWYRKHITIPQEIAKSPAFTKYRALQLALGAIDDVDSTWFNGQKIGSTGSFPDDYRTAWDKPRTYTVPSSAIRWGADNVIAVRVYDRNGAGGMVSGPYKLQFATSNIPSRFLEPDNNGIIRDDKLNFGATLMNEFDTNVTNKVRWTVTTDQRQQLARESVEAVIPANDKLTLPCPFAPLQPGFYHFKCELFDEGRAAGAKTQCLGLNPELVTSKLTREADFDEFWARTKKDLANVKPEFRLTRAPKFDSNAHEVYEVEMRSLGNIRVRGWYQKPKAAGKHPALLRVPGYTQAMYPMEEVTENVAILSFNVRAHGNSQQDVSGKPADYWVRGLDDKDDYFYRGCYADCIRAVDFLESREEVDASRIGITGASQGGGLSLATAALDSRITACAPDIPFLCDWIRYFKVTESPEIHEWIAEQPERSWESTLKTMSYFDALNLADKITCPVFLGLGLQDEVCPPATVFSVYNRLNVPKEFRVYPDAGHWVGPPHHQLKRDWLWKQLKCGSS